ncbi:hypothetical protein GGR58DRAFT_504417 [Xylaria digitata]|nr:hypothetical protein GGR58DRAFT_504417 [Xylaria digitata]
MDPLSALSVACNIIDLVDKGIKAAATVVEIYKSVDGISKNNEIINREVGSLKDIVADLQNCQSQASYNTADQNIREISTTLTSKCAELQSVVDECKSSQKRGWLSATNAYSKILRKRGKIEQLQSDIVSSQNQLSLRVAASTRTVVISTLKRLEAVSQTSCEIQSTVDKADTLLSASYSVVSSVRPPGNDAAACLEEVRQVVADRVILQLLDFPTLKSRFEDVATEEEGTFKWIFTQLGAVLEKEPELSTTFPDWLESGDGIFHICGKPGSGKSTLMKYICRNPATARLLAKWSKNNELLVAKFFFWRVGVVQEQKSMRGLIRGLLHQILSKVPKLSREIFPKETREKLVDGLQRHSGAELESDEIMTAFSRLVEVSTSSTPGQGLRGIRICLFIDGLDEFEITKTDQSHNKLVDKLRQWTKNSNGHVKICVSSRIGEPFMGMLDKSKRFTIHKLTEPDIALFIKKSLESHPRFRMRQQKSPNECQQLINTIRQSADGVFLWVALVLKDLDESLSEGIPMKRLLEIVSGFPGDLDALLERIMNSITIGSRRGVEVLLSAMLRATGTLLSSEDRDPEHVQYDAYDSEFNLRALGSFLVMHAADTGVLMCEDLNMKEFDFDKEEWLQDGMADCEIMKIIINKLQTRCKGLVDIGDTQRHNNTVKFMHRSVPEFLHTYFSRASAFNDHKSTVLMSWAVMADVKWERAKKQSSSLLSFLRGKPIPHSAKVIDDFDLLLSRYTFLFTARLRQVKLVDGWEDLFSILHGIPRNYRSFSRAFLDTCATNGLYEFIDWLFRNTDIISDRESQARVMCGFGSPFALKVMETGFKHGIDGRIEDTDGQLVWHDILMGLRLGSHRWETREADIVELWLTHGADPRVRFQIRDGNKCVGISCASDNSGHTFDPALRYIHYKIHDLEDNGVQELSLRDLVLHWKPYNEARLLELLKDDAEEDIPGAGASKT